MHYPKIDFALIGPLHDLVTWYGINYAGTQITQWDFQNKGISKLVLVQPDFPLFESPTV